MFYEINDERKETLKQVQLAMTMRWLIGLFIKRLSGYFLAEEFSLSKAEEIEKFEVISGVTASFLFVSSA